MEDTLKIRGSRFHTLTTYDASKRYYSIITHAHTFHGDVNARRYFSENGTISLRGNDEGANKREETAAKDTRCERIGTWRRGRSLHSGRIGDTKRGDLFSLLPLPPPPLPLLPPPRLPRADGDCKRTWWSEMAPLISDAPNAIRTTLSRNISQIGVECLAQQASKRMKFASQGRRAVLRLALPMQYFQIRKPRSHRRDVARERHF